MNNGIDSSDDYNRRDCDNYVEKSDSITVYVNEYLRREAEYEETLKKLSLVRNKLIGPLAIPEKRNSDPVSDTPTFPIIGVEISMIEILRELNARLINLNNNLSDITNDLTRII